MRKNRKPIREEREYNVYRAIIGNLGRVLAIGGIAESSRFIALSESGLDPSKLSDIELAEWLGEDLEGIYGKAKCVFMYEGRTHIFWGGVHVMGSAPFIADSDCKYAFHGIDSRYLRAIKSRNWEELYTIDCGSSDFTFASGGVKSTVILAHYYCAVYANQELGFYSFNANDAIVEE